MPNIQQIQDQIIDEFNFFEDWSEKYQYLIDLGKNLPEFKESNRIDSNLIKGCQSKVWLHAELSDGKINFLADSEAIITKGIISILLNVFNNRTPDEILSSNMDFIEKIGLKEHLSPNRANGLSSMYKQIKFYAIAFSKT